MKNKLSKIAPIFGLVIVIGICVGAFNYIMDLEDEKDQAEENTVQYVEDTNTVLQN